jgi:hypothetical protein
MKSYTLDPRTNVFHPAGRASAVAYSDGAGIEEHLLDALSRAQDRSLFSPELVRHIRNWPSLYHLSPSRANLLRPIAHRLRGNVLEVGAGCGAITRYLGECGGPVIALEGSERRAAIAAQRCLDLENVRVVCDNFFDFAPSAPFSAVVCVGVLEYSGLYDREGGGIGAAVRRLASLLADGGVLIIAIENQLGLKYLAGAPEDHLSVPYYGVSGLYVPGEPATLGRQELERCLEESGLGRRWFLYPFPDYKMPTLMVDTSALEEPRLDLGGIIADNATSAAPFGYLSAFPEELAWPVVGRNGLTAALANSFLVVASASGSFENAADGALLWKYSTERTPPFRKEAVIERAPDATLRVRSRLLNPDLPRESGGYRIELSEREFICGEQYCQALYRIVNRRGWSLDQVRDWARPWLALLDRNSQGPDRQSLPSNFIDCIPKNLIVSPSGALVPFDLEYVAEGPVLANHVRLRGMLHALRQFNGCAPPAATLDAPTFELARTVLSLAGYPMPDQEAAACLAAEARFLETVQGVPAAEAERLLATGRLRIRFAPSAPEPAANRSFRDRILTVARGLRQRLESRLQP